MVGFGYAGMAFMWLPMAICAMLLIAAPAMVIFVALQVGRGGQSGVPTQGAGSARQILDDRYARGDIDHDE